jgi:transmembrane sensor
MALTSDEYSRIASYLSGELKGEEKIAFERWINAGPEAAAAFKEAKHIWESSGLRYKLHHLDTDAEWNELNIVLQKDSGKIIRWTGQALWLRIAASLLIVLIAGIWLFRSPNRAPELIRYSATEQVARFHLPDSTEVWLNLNSSLSYDPMFNSGARDVTLEGEGYFKVRRNEQKPFTVHTGIATIRVLGTAFNVKEQEGKVNVAVAEGTVNLYAADAGDSHGIILHAREMGSLSRGQSPSKESLSNTDVAAWRQSFNPEFENEKNAPEKFIKPHFEFRKNVINQSVIAGTLQSSSGLAVYRNIVLRVNYTKANGKSLTTRITIEGPVRPGEVFPFEKRLLDIFSVTRKMELVVESAEAGTAE